jgi:hypothetical protein
MPSPVYQESGLLIYIDLYIWPFQFQNKSVPRKQTMNYRKVAKSVGRFHNIFLNLKLSN